MVLAQQPVNLITEPVGLAEFEDIAHLAGQTSQEALQAVNIDMPARRKLKKHGAESRAEALYGIKVRGKLIVHFAEFSRVRYGAIGFDSKEEVVGGRLSPAINSMGGRHSVKGIIQLDSVEIAAVEVEEALRLRALGIENANPVSIVPARCADANFANSSSHLLDETSPGVNGMLRQFS